MNTEVLLPYEYCTSLTAYSRRETRKVNIGNIPLGGNEPIRVQSMTTVNTLDTKGSIEQSIRLIEAGCEYVRITAPSMKEAKNLELIKAGLHKQGYHIPLIADIHFTPNAAECAARIVEKVRINPGNYADKKRFNQIDYTEKTYQAELDRVRSKFIPLIKICKEYGTAMRIGANHGSLSDRIMSRYGDTPLGMVESALEFVRICEELSYYDIVLSMKSSNPQTMIQAYRLLVHKLTAEALQPYPLHLGVTEAGEGEDGRIKSAVGIGTLLEDGLGDTIRVSLTEEPELEIKEAKILADRYINRVKILDKNTIQYSITPFEYRRRHTVQRDNFGGTQVPRVIVDFSGTEKITSESLSAVGYRYAASPDKWHIGDMACDYLYAGNRTVDFPLPGTLGVVYDHTTWLTCKEAERSYPLIEMASYLNGVETSNKINFLRLCSEDLSKKQIEKIKYDPTVILLITTGKECIMATLRSVFVTLINEECKVPVVVGTHYTDITWEQMRMYLATDIGGLLTDGLGDGVFITATDCATHRQINEAIFALLQATRTRISKTEYISCPSCGRTLFSLQETTAMIRAKTNHLKGIKIAVMGCIVNGPGEMADADYGYVGSGPDKITLYRGKEIVRRHIPSVKAVDELIGLIREDGKWVDAHDRVH